MGRLGDWVLGVPIGFAGWRNMGIYHGENIVSGPLTQQRMRLWTRFWSFVFQFLIALCSSLLCKVVLVPISCIVAAPDLFENTFAKTKSFGM
ncbi:hypothetical protein DM860_013202 [Cuscuta australis]|uniref:Uncharacterized protein n=1 Tax=Cuscuta australis TaxID=267555 RepID=A0A328DNH6_9ASTE|nr:hypothetical protein DM860_013202 [Cuscuta australis]